MQLTKLIIAAFAIMALCGCSKESADVESGQEKVVNVKLAFVSSDGSRMIEDGHDQAVQPTVKTIKVEALGSNSAVLNSIDFTTQSDLDALTGVNGLPISVSSSATQIRVTANATDKTDVKDLQGFDIVPVEGTGNIEKAAGSGTQADPYTATVEITPAMARIEVYGGINVTLNTPAANTKYYAVDVEEIFINNIKLTKNAATATLNNTDTAPWNTWYGAYTTGDFKNMSDQIAAAGGAGKPFIPTAGGKYYATTPDHNIGVADGKAAGFNIFPQTTEKTAKEDIAAEMPHVVLRVKIYKDATDYAKGAFIADREFVTVRLFNDGASAPENIKKMTAGNIYRLNLNDLAGYFIDTMDPADPDPEGGKTQVSVKVSVVKWKVTNIKPEL